MKKIYLTFDIETIVSGISRSDNYLASVYLGAMFMAEELRKRNLKATFYISLSSKQENIQESLYLDMLKWLVQSLKSYENIKTEPHIHALNLPVSFESKSDQFEKYNLDQQIELLTFAKDFFANQGVQVSSFRPGGFSKNESYYQALHTAGYKYSSILYKSTPINIDMTKGNSILESPPYSAAAGVIEYPVTSVKIKSIKGKIEVLNLSPDFFTIASVQKYIETLSYVNINFHSFSIYLNRLIRENHKGLAMKNLKFLLLETPLNYLLRATNLQTIHRQTVMSTELLRWLDYIKKKEYDTFFIGE